MKTVVCLVAILMSFCSLANSTIINIPADHSTIQAGIDASSDGDTVLVQPGTYLENINFNGHNIVLGSLFLTTGDTSYLSTTTIDGNADGRVVTLVNGEDSTAVITGFIIENGNGGISCVGSNPQIIHNIIRDNDAGDYLGGVGGGIYCSGSSPRIANNKIIGNCAGGWYLSSSGFGGGIYCGYSSNPTIVNNTIAGNWTTSDGWDEGGGIYCRSSSPLIINNTVVANRALDGEGIFCDDADPVIMNSIMWYNNIESIGNLSPTVAYCDYQDTWPGEGNISSKPNFINPTVGNWTVCAQSPCLNAGDPERLDPDGTRSDIGVYSSDHQECFVGNVWHISAAGSDSTGDGSPGNPFGTIQHGIDLAIPGDTVLAGRWTFEEDFVMMQFKELALISNYALSGDTADLLNTVISGDSRSGVAIFRDCDSIATLMGFTIENRALDWGPGIACDRASPMIANNIIHDMTYSGIICNLGSEPIIVGNSICDNDGSGIASSKDSNPLIRENYIGGNQVAGIYSSWSSAPYIVDNVIANNYSPGNGGGIICYWTGGNPVIRDNVIIGNVAEEKGGGIYCSFAGATITENTVIENSAGTQGGGIYCSDFDIIAKNNVIAGNSAVSGGGIYCSNSDPTIVNNTLFANSALFLGNGIFCDSSAANITNTIVWGSATSPSGAEIFSQNGAPVITYCDILGGWRGEGNINIDPLFRDPENGDYHLMSTACGDPYDSPCIDMGDPTILDSLLSCAWGLGAARSDMGAYGGDGSIPTGIEDDDPVVLPSEFALYQNYPNPFNATTTISYSLPKRTHVKLEIYNLLGQRVERLADGQRHAGHHAANWDASRYSSGIYFYKLSMADKVITKRMTLLK